MLDGKVYRDEPTSAVLLGMQRRHLAFTPVEKLKDTTDFKYVYRQGYMYHTMGISWY